MISCSISTDLGTFTLGNGNLNLSSCSDDEFEPAQRGLYLVGTVPETGFFQSMEACAQRNASSDQGAVILYVIRYSGSERSHDIVDTISVNTYSNQQVISSTVKKKIDNSKHPMKGDSIAVYYHPSQFFAVKKNSSKPQYGFWRGSNNWTSAEVKRMIKKEKDSPYGGQQCMDVELNIRIIFYPIQGAQ
ncbi:hypothetical protein SPONN_1727 [uncultured Candidatus Thioglobus sp.]|nr:hypothetical protein SPONN_1727 [uncultured Candidatus Thioglobus sp.]